MIIYLCWHVMLELPCHARVWSTGENGRRNEIIHNNQSSIEVRCVMWQTDWYILKRFPRTQCGTYIRIFCVAFEIILLSHWNERIDGNSWMRIWGSGTKKKNWNAFPHTRSHSCICLLQYPCKPFGRWQLVFFFAQSIFYFTHSHNLFAKDKLTNFVCCVMGNKVQYVRSPRVLFLPGHVTYVESSTRNMSMEHWNGLRFDCCHSI